MSIMFNIIWCVVSYFIAREYEVEGYIKAINYSLLTFFFGFMFSMGVLMTKVGEYKNRNGLKIVGILGIAFGVIINLLVILA